MSPYVVRTGFFKTLVSWLMPSSPSNSPAIWNLSQLRRRTGVALSYSQGW
jgi:hypothetical protein